MREVNSLKPEVRVFDHRGMALVQKIPRGWATYMRALSFLGQPLVVLAGGFIGYLVALSRGQSKIQHAFVYAVIAFILSTLLKLSLRRARPHNLDVRTFGVKSYSFPSGHAFGTVIFYGLFSYLSLRYLAHPWDIMIALIIWCLIALIGLSRVYLKAHYPSDVAGGWLLGLIALSVVISLAF